MTSTRPLSTGALFRLRWVLGDVLERAEQRWDELDFEELAEDNAENAGIICDAWFTLSGVREALDILRSADA